MLEMNPLRCNSTRGQGCGIQIPLGEGMTKSDNPAQGAQLEFRDRMAYADYLHLEKVLDAQTPLSSAHDELLFIIQHQTSELWMKLAIHEVRSAIEAIRKDDPQPAFKMLTRVARIFEQLNNAWDVLRTMTPSEYTEFRGALGQSSGFQSYQYRAIEFLAGNRNLVMLKPHEHRSEVMAALDSILAAPSLYDEALLLLSRQGFDIGADAQRTDWRQTRPESAEVLAAWRQIYREPRKYWTLYELAEKLVDFEDYFRRWRFNHVTTVERIIGLKRGTGGTAGVSYLRKMLEVELFPELWKVRTEL
jgi:tryptophan 2,3-dioxygenase